MAMLLDRRKLDSGAGLVNATDGGLLVPMKTREAACKNALPSSTSCIALIV